MGRPRHGRAARRRCRATTTVTIHDERVRVAASSAAECSSRRTASWPRRSAGDGARQPAEPPPAGNADPALRRPRWHGYTYRWNDEQTDATLVPASGDDDRPSTVKDAQSRRAAFANRPGTSPAAPSAGPATIPGPASVGFTAAAAQPRPRATATSSDQPSWRRCAHARPHRGSRTGTRPPRQCANPYDADGRPATHGRGPTCTSIAPHCHQFGAGGTADIQLLFDVGRWNR